MVSHKTILEALDAVAEALDRCEGKEDLRARLDTIKRLVKEQEAAILGEIKSINTRLSEQIQISREALKCRSS